MATGPADFAIDSLSRSGTVLDAAIRAVRDCPTDPVDAVHELRVAIRQVRSDLRVFSPVFEPRWIEATRDRLAAIADVVGETRDHDVMLGRLRELATIVPKSDRATVSVLLSQLDRDRDASFRRLFDLLRDPETASVATELASAAHASLASDADGVDTDDLVAATRRQWRRLRKAVRAVDDGDEKLLHKVRIRAKTLRYSLETLHPLLHASARRHAEALVALQDHLGEMQDAEVLERWLRRELGGHNGADFVIGELVGIERARKDRVRSEWRGQWKRAARRRHRRWMR